jgi:DNA modification methylase
MSASIVRGDARHLPLPATSVDLIVTSPPYFGLRSYQDGGEHYDGQIGAEATPREYVAALLECTAEWMRVLKPEGSLWINLGDKYSGAQAQNDKRDSARIDSAAYWRQTNPKNTGIPAKSLMGFPWRYALRCIDDLGLILRAEVIWSKPNGLPESVTDRVRRSHEQWFHMVKSPRYFSAVDEIREPHIAPERNHGENAMRGRNVNIVRTGTGSYAGSNALGKVPGSVWEIATQPLKVPAELAVQHFASFPLELPRRIISGWSPSGICTACGEGRRPTVTRDRRNTRPLLETTAHLAAHQGNDGRAFSRGETDVAITGYACACPDTIAPTRPSVVLDPFGGTGTTSLVADVLGRHGVSVDMSADYCRLAAWRTTDPGERARAIGVPKPAPVMTGQGDLFGEAS